MWENLTLKKYLNQYSSILAFDYTKTIVSPLTNHQISVSGDCAVIPKVWRPTEHFSFNQLPNPSYSYCKSALLFYFSVCGEYLVKLSRMNGDFNSSSKCIKPQMTPNKPKS